MNEYTICSYLLYDNQLDMDYIILSDNDYFGNALNKIYNLKSEISNKQKFEDMSIKLMEEACETTNHFFSECLFIKNNDIIRLVKSSSTHIDRYNGYDIIWNEEKSGVNPFRYKKFIIWNKGMSSVSSLRIDENEKIRYIRDKQLNKILE